jgi:Protein of unknown function (DUF3800)
VAAGQQVLRIYIDDSGEKEYGANTSRYFVYAGVVLSTADKSACNTEIERLKVKCSATLTWNSSRTGSVFREGEAIPTALQLDRWPAERVCGRTLLLDGSLPRPVRRRRGR